MILANLWRRKTRTLLTVLGIAVGVATVVALSAFGEGLATGFERVFASSTADLTVSEAEAVMLFMSTVDEAVGDDLRQLGPVAEVAGRSVNIINLPDVPYFILAGEDPRGFAIAHYRLIAGGPLTGRKQVLIGRTTAENFHKGVGDAFVLNEVIFRVAGIYETGEALEDGGAVISLADAQRLFDRRGKVNYFVLQLRDPRAAEAVKAEIEARWPALTATRSGQTSQQAELFNIYRYFGLFVGALAAVVGGLGMMNTMLMSVVERTQEIGVLRALGWPRWRVLGLILGEALALAGLGGLAGVGLGLGLMWLTSQAPAVASLLSGTVTPLGLAQAMVMAVVLGVVGGLYPAWRAAQLQPIEAMRAEAGGSGHPPQWMPRLPGGAAVRDLWRRPARTLLTLASIGVAVGFIVALTGIAEGVIQEFGRLLGAGQMDLMGTQAGVADMEFSEIDERLADRLRVQPEVAGVSRLLFGFPATTEAPFLMVFGLDPGETYIQHYVIRAGRPIQRSGELLLGGTAAANLHKQVGDELSLGTQRFQVVGIYENGSAYEDTGAMMWLRDAQELLNKRHKVSFLGVALKNPEQAVAVARVLEARFPQVTLNTTTTLRERTQDMQTLYAILNTLIGLTLVVGGVVMTNAMLMSVFERTQEIGVLRALGWSRARVVGLVLTEALLLSVLSALMGGGLGLALAHLLTLMPVVGEYLAPAYTPQMLAQVAALTLGLGAAGGVYPAWRAASLRPMEALRYE